MPGFYDVNGNQPPKSNESKKKKGFYSIDNKDTKNTLEYDGVTLGTVTNKGLKAIETNTLDSYTPETEEEKATIESYKSLKRKDEHELSKQAKEKSRYKAVKETIGEPNKTAELLKPDFKTTVNTSFGDVKVDLSPNPLTSPHTANEVVNYANKKAEKEEAERKEYEKAHPIKSNIKKTIADVGYIAESIGAGVIGGVESVGQFLTAGAHSLLSDVIDASEVVIDHVYPFDNSALSKKMLDTSELIENEGKKILENKYIGETWKDNIEERYSDSTHKAIAKLGLGNTAYAGGTLLPAIVTEVLTIGGSPMGDIWIAKNLLNAGKVASTASKVAKYVSPSEVVFGLSAMGSSSSQAVREGANLDSALMYGTLNGLGEVATERIFGGLAGTKLGKSIISYKPSSKIIDSAFNLGGEGIEEMLMAFADPHLRRATFDSDAELASIKDYTESAKQGMLLSLFMKVAFFPFSVKSSIERTEAVKAVNSVVDGINQIIVDDAKKITALPKNASAEEIQAKQKEIQKYAELYAKQLNAEVSKNLTENADTINAKYQEVEDTLKSEAKETYNSVVEAFKEALKGEDTAVSTENKVVDTSPIKIGDTFKANNEAESVIKVIGRNDNVTTVEVTYKNGETETMEVKNDFADSMINNPKYTRMATETAQDNVDTSVTETVDTTKTLPMETTETISTVTDVTPTTETITPSTSNKGITSAYTNDNQKIDLRYKVVSADDLIVSNNADGSVNPNYPQELQPRERTRTASIMQVQNIANNIVPEKLGESTNVSDGSPIVSSDNVVESGNGRTMALSLMYKTNPEGANRYVEYLKANADKFGIDADNLPANPILVRERLTDVDRVEFVKKANESNLGAMSATELAKSDAERLTSDILNLLVPNDDGNINTAENRPFVARVISNVFSQNDLNSVVGANGMLSSNGLERIQNALFYKAYNDVSLASRLAESLDNDIKNITKVLLNIAPKVVAIKNGIANGTLYDLDFSQDIVDGINFLQNAKESSLSVENFANQLTIGDSTSDIAKAIAYIFEQKKRGAKQATLLFNHLFDIIMEKDPNQLSFLGETKTPTKERVLDEAIDKYNNDEQRTGEAVSVSERIIPQRSEESARENDTGRAVNNVESASESAIDGGEGDGTREQQGYVKETSVVGGDESTSRPSENGTADSRAENIADETEVGAGELSYDDFTLDKIKHPKTEKDIWVIRPKERVENFKELQAKMKALGGYYSRFAETPHGKGGFEFKNDPSNLFIETQEVTNNVRGKENSDSKEMERNVTGREEVPQQSVQEKIKEILLKPPTERNSDEIVGKRTELKETAEEFEGRASDDGYKCISLSKKTIAFKESPESKWNRNAKEATAILETLGVTVIVFEGEYRSNVDGISQSASQAVTVGRGETLTVFVSADLEADGMETAYHEAFHALKRNGYEGEELYSQIVDIISDGVDVECESFEIFVSNIAEAYSHGDKGVSVDEITEEFSAWYIGSIYASKNEHDVDMLAYINDFSNPDNIKPQIDAIFTEVKSDAVTEPPTDNAQNKPILNETKSDEQTPTEKESTKIGQNNTPDNDVDTNELTNETDNTEVSTETESTTTKSKGTKQIADYVADKLSKGEKITAIELSMIATKAFGGTMADNVFTVKDAYDAMELGVNKYILSMENVSAQKMLELLELLPTQTKRTEEMIKFQQFSTPPSIAYLANYVANVNSDDIMLEPSAGIGGIAVFAKRDGATVYVNELDTRRLEVLRNMPFDRFFNENAEQLDNILGGKIEPTVIVMNPPFSSSSERNIHNTKIGAKHIEEALKILAPNGRLVAIVGHGMGDGAPAFRDWWKDIKSKYNVRANIRINGKNYNKYGTNFDIQMLVIDKNGATTHTETGYVDTLQELQEKLESIREDRPNVESNGRIETNKGTEQKPSELTRKETSRTRKGTGVGIESVSGTDSLADNGKSTYTTGTTRKSDVEVLQTTDADGGRADNQAPQNTDVVDDGQPLDRRGELGGHTELRDGGRVDISDSGQHSKQPTVDRSDRNVGVGQNDVGVQRRKRTELTDSIFEQYQTQPLKFKNTKSHPGKVSESSAMSAITPPAVTYKPHLSQDIVENGVVSDVQLEAISYAGQSHSQILANGTRRGFFLGDGTGIGKGRTIAGMMLDNYNQGRKKAIWVTENESLMLDAKRDVTALFGNSDLLTQFEGGKKADKIYGKDEAILVVSYGTLSRGFDKKGSNFEKIIDWLGKDFDGLVVFDEAHNMANATGKKGKRGGTKPSQTGLAGIAFQKALPKSRVVYSSATGATEVENLRYAERLGLWGEGTAFTNGDDFVGKIKAGGIASMELIARDMKAMGVYLSRNISYDDVQYDKITHELTPQQIKIYDELARSWQIVLQNINKALENTNQDKDGHARGRALGAFWSSQQRFFNQILTSMQVPSVIADIEKQLVDGKSCVIQLVSTNESAQNREMERIKSEDLDLDEFDLTPKQMLMSMIEHSFPVHQYEEYIDDDGNKKSQPVYDSMGNPVLNREAVKQRDELLDKLGSIKVPSSPIDMIINHFGTDLVAEKTGRSRRVIQKDGKTIEENIASKKDADVEAFQNGDKRIMIFSKAGGTGKSYHADKSAKNQQQRVHYLLEAGWQADKAVQGFGRSHRSNQVSAPIFKLVTTNLKGQMRFISTIAKRLDQLGAMTKGQRQAGGQGMFSASDNLENSLASDVLAVFYKDLLANRVYGIDNGLAIIEKLGLKDKILDEYNNIRVNAEELRDVSKFLNRILSLESSEQNTVFDGYSQRLQEATEKAMADGTLDKGLENYKADKITLNEVKDIREDERSGAKTKYYNLTAEHKIKPVKFEDINTESKSFVGFYRNKNTGVVRAVMRTSSTTDQYGNITDNYKLVGQVKNEYIPQHRLYGNWVEIKTDEAEKSWNEELTKLPEYRKENLHLISGVVLPVWDKLPTENVRIYRVLTSDGEMLIGRVVSEEMIDETLRRLGSSRTKEKIATSDLIAGIKNGDTVHLENDWKIVQRKVSGENRIELVGANYQHYEILKEKGVFSERIQYSTRYFVPSNTNTEKIIDEILKISPVYRVENAKYSIESEVHTSEREGSLLSNGSREWSYSTSTGKQTKRMDGRTRRYKEGRTTAFERRKYCQTLKTSGNTRQEIISGHKCEVIPTEHYTPLMTKITKQNAKDGIDETIFITGKATLPFIKDSNGNPKTARGVFIKTNGKKINIVQYDNEYYSPEQINDHEKIHDNYQTPLVQKAKNVIMNSLSVADRKHILEKLSRDYNGIIEGNEDDIIEEFVANVLSEMDYEYIGDFSDIVKAYWKGDEAFIDNFKVSEYSEAIDAGGANTNVLDNIGLGNDYELNSSNQLYLSADEYAVVSRAVMAKNAGLSDNELKPFDYAYSANNLYVYKNHSLGNFTIVTKFNLVTDKDVLSYVKEAINNGTFRNGQGFNKWSGSIQSKRGRDNSYPKRVENTGTARTDDRLPIVSRGSNDVGHSLGDGTYPSGNYVKYSFDSAESDIEELTPERQKEIHEQFEKDRVGVDKPTQKQVWGERWDWIRHNMSRVFPDIPERGEKGVFFAEFRKNMVQWTKLPQTASFMVQDKLGKMTKDLTPEEYRTFSELVYFLDLQEEAQIQKERGFTEILLPNEITPTEVDSIVKVLNEEATENVKQALVKRQEIWDALKTQYIELNHNIGFDTDGKFKRKNYYHHQVIEYMNRGGKGTGNREISIKAGRGWLKERQGSTKAINTDFLAVEYQAMLQMQYDVYIAETLGKIKEQYDIKPQLEVEARNHNKQALNDIIRKEATDEEGNLLIDEKGKPKSETYHQQMWYNSRIMFGFDGLFDLAERDELPTYDGEYSSVVEALKRNNLNVGGLYKYVGMLANTDLPDNATDAQEQAVINARTILKYSSQKREWIKGVLGDNYQTWETIAKSMSDTHTIHQPRRGNYFYTKTVIDEDAFNQAYQEMVLSLASGDIDFGSKDLNTLFAEYADTVRLMGVAYEQWVLPKEIVTTMHEIANPKQAGEVAKLARTIITAWKGWSTGLNPLRTVKYGVRNMLGDLDVVIAGKPQVLRYFKKAVQDIYQAMRHKNYSPEFMEWIERGGYTAMQYVNEMDTEMQDKLFSHLKEKSGIDIFKIPSDFLKGYAKGVETLHNFREAILRYSSYLYFKEAIKRSDGVVKDNVASNRYIIRGLNTVEDKAYQLSKDLLGAYDEVGKMGQTMRRYFVPFYSFAETNLKRYYRMFENVIMSDDKIPKKVGKLLLKFLMVNMLTLLITAWNRLVMEEEDDKLPPSARNVPHITLGQNGDNVIAFTKPSSFSDILEWVGFEDYKWTSEDWTAPIDKAWGMITPFVKLPVELASGLNFYPSLTQPRAIRDKWEHFFNSWGVAGVYNEVTGKPTRGFGELVKGAVVYSYDYEESAYYEILDIKRKYQGETDNTIYGVDKKSNALYYMKSAIKYKDEKVAYKYLDEYFENGGTARGLRQSLATLNPLYGFTGKDTYEKGVEFIKSLTDEEKEKLIIAQDYYEKDLMMPENVLAFLGKKGVTEEDAKTILRAYIKAKCKK